MDIRSLTSLGNGHCAWLGARDVPSLHLETLAPTPRPPLLHKENVVSTDLRDDLLAALAERREEREETGEGISPLLLAVLVRRRRRARGRAISLVVLAAPAEPRDEGEEIGVDDGDGDGDGEGGISPFVWPLYFRMAHPRAAALTRGATKRHMKGASKRWLQSSSCPGTRTSYGVGSIGVHRSIGTRQVSNPETGDGAATIRSAQP
jgi:hypothetical protein